MVKLTFLAQYYRVLGSTNMKKSLPRGHDRHRSMVYDTAYLGHLYLQSHCRLLGFQSPSKVSTHPSRMVPERSGQYSFRFGNLLPAPAIRHPAEFAKEAGTSWNVEMSYINSASCPFLFSPKAKCV
jgi:hypothetical protein